LDGKLEYKIFCTKWQQAFPDFSLLFVHSDLETWPYRLLSFISIHF
jgi:hypothetical protein